MVRTVLRDAASVGSVMIMTEAAVADAPKQASASSTWRHGLLSQKFSHSG